MNQKIKDTAKLFLHLDPTPDKVLPFLIHHPFIRDNPSFIKDKNGNNILFDIFKDKENYNKLINSYEDRINKANDFSEIVYLFSKPYRLFFFYYVKDMLNKQDFNKYLKDLWISTEFPNADKNVSVAKLLSMFKDADKTALMDDKELKQYNELPEKVTIYRGTYREDNSKALSWTTDYDIAYWFAIRFDDNGYVLKAIIDKKDIIAFFDDRNEQEVIVDYKKIKDLSFEKVKRIEI